MIVADITNERPNCYLEVGYAMGLGKKANLILTAREDTTTRVPELPTAKAPKSISTSRATTSSSGAPTTCRPSTLSSRIVSGAGPRSCALAKRQSNLRLTSRGATNSARKPKLA